jgi:hypothetical protein
VKRNPRDRECFVNDVDLDGFIAEYELVCYRWDVSLSQLGAQKDARGRSIG